MLDTSGDGILDLEELRMLLRVLGQDLTDIQLRQKAGFRATEEVLLDFDGFCNLMEVWQREELIAVFRFFDDDDSGEMIGSEIETAILALLDVTPEDAAQMAEFIDSDGSGTVDEGA
jgi:Ca2+-binding EF-hand superfamily protein